MTKSELLNGLQEEYQQWEAFLDQIGPARMDQPGVNGNWSMKDLVAHLTGCHRWLIARLQAAHRREPEPPPPWPAHLQAQDDINAWIYETNRGRSVREVLDESQQVFQQRFALVEGLPEAVRIEPLHQGERYFCWCGWAMNASTRVSSLTISVMSTSRMSAPGWREWRNNSCSPTQQSGSPKESRYGYPLENDHLATVRSGY